MYVTPPNIFTSSSCLCLLYSDFLLDRMREATRPPQTEVQRSIHSQWNIEPGNDTVNAELVLQATLSLIVLVNLYSYSLNAFNAPRNRPRIVIHTR